MESITKNRQTVESLRTMVARAYGPDEVCDTGEDWVGELTDGWFNIAQATQWVTIDEFVDGFVHVDGRYDVERADGAGHLVATGELGLGTHEEGRELVVTLVRDDGDAVVATGRVEPGWHHGEWVARLPLPEAGRGTFRVRATLTDAVCPTLTRKAVSQPIHLS